MAGSMEAQQVGYGFNPTDERLVDHFLKKKLKGEMDADCRIPELYIYNWEPSELFILYNVFSSESSDGRECFFFCPRGGRKRTTNQGYWKETSSKRVIQAAGTGEPMGTKRYLTYYEGQQPKGHKTNVAMHEYHLKSDVSDSEILDPLVLVLCRIFYRESKKAKSATANASTALNGLSNLNSEQATLGDTFESNDPNQALNAGLPDNVTNSDQQPQTGNKQCWSNYDNWHDEGPSYGPCSMPYSPSDGIDLMDFLNFDESTGETQTCKERHLGNDDNRHVDGPSNGHCYMPYSPSDGIDLEDLLSSN